MELKLPMGIQGFEKLRSDHFLYVDKTAYIYQLAQNNVPYFLSRPRRFGKSLLISAMKAYWEGKRELFSGLVIEGLEAKRPDAWQPYPVFHFDFNGDNYRNTAIETVLDGMLRDWEEIYGSAYQDRTLGDRFQKLLEMACAQTGHRCVVLIDEYDKPLLDVVEDSEQQEHIKEVFKGFFSRLKKADEYIHFIFITGVTKFHKVSIFSDLNQLTDISMNEDYAALCGITEEEIDKYLPGWIEQLALRKKMTIPECKEELRKRYDGYHFHPDGAAVYNPYSLFGALFAKDFGAYWFETGTPTFLVHRLKEADFDTRKLTDRTLYAGEGQLRDYTGDNLDIVPLLYQTGYLTIVDYDSVGQEYTLAFPNDEVKYGFLESLMPAYVAESGPGSGRDIFTLRRYVEQGDLDGIRDVLIALFANITYTLASDPFEHYFQTVIYLVFTLLNKFVQCEMHTFMGRIDCRVETVRYIYLFEFKRDDSADNALRQIDSKEYTLSFAADSRTLYKIGVSFDSRRRMLDEWKCVKNNS